jgi:4-amino-4-deoxy-L-arabinose transferase-like glycosyltransferase
VLVAGGLSASARGLILAAIVALSVGIRLAFAFGAGDERVWGWQWIQVNYLELGTNIADGRGYLLALSPEALQVQVATPGLPTLQSLPHDFARPYRPIEYFLPGYAYLIAPAIAVSGQADWQVVRTLNGVIDGVAGPLLVYLLLSRGGAGLPAASIGALLYGVSPQLVRMDAQVMPDSLSSVLTLAPVAFLAVAWKQRRRAAAAALAGAAIGAACAFRGEIVALLPLLAAFLVLAASDVRQRLNLVALLFGAWLLASAPLAISWNHVYGEVAISRPGLGVRLWEGIGAFPNPWNVIDSDEAASALLAQNGLSYGSSQGDGFLLREALEHFRDSPALLAHDVAVRGRDVVRYGFEGWFEWWPALEPLKATLGFGLAALAAIGAIALPAQHRFLFGLLACVWISRAIPFSFLEVQPRDLIPLQVTYGCAIACGVAALLPAARSIGTYLGQRRTAAADPWSH